MLKKIVVGILVVTVVGGAAFAMLDRPAVIAAETLTPAPTAQVTAPEPTGAGVEIAPAGTAQPVQQQQSVNNVGEVWSATGTILDLGSVGMTLALSDGSTVYVELGSTEFWQSQPVPLNIGESVTVDGFFNGTDYHARTVTNANGAMLALRDENGQPLWSGGASNSNGNGANGGQGEVQVPADEWVTVEGTVTALTNNGVVVQTTDAQALTVSFGRADFWQTQAVTFAAGDAISMMGFWQVDQFQVGQVTKTATGERILLRDPNGRPLWAGPGRGEGNGNGNNRNGNGANGNGNSSADGSGSSTGNGSGSNGQGNGKSNGNGSGNQYRGQRQPPTGPQQP